MLEFKVLLLIIMGVMTLALCMAIIALCVVVLKFTKREPVVSNVTDLQDWRQKHGHR